MVSLADGLPGKVADGVNDSVAMARGWMVSLLARWLRQRSDLGFYCMRGADGLPGKVAESVSDSMTI